MNISIVLSVFILAVAAVLGWRDRQRLTSIRDNHARLVAEAAALGISIDPANPTGPPLVTRHAEREDKQAAAKEAAARLIAFARELEAMQKKGEGPDDAMQKRIMECMELMMSLNAAQLKTVIAEFRAAGDIKDEMRQGLIGFAIMTMAESQPQAALALFTESSDLFKNGGMGEHVISSALGRWANNDPMGALEWVRKNGEKFPDLVTEEAKSAVISGAAAQDPKLALQLIGELKLKDASQAISRIASAAKTPEERTATLAALREHLATIPDQAERDSMLNNACSSLLGAAAKDGFESATQWISQAGFSSDEVEKLSRILPYNVKLGETSQWVEWLGKTLPAGRADDGINRMVSKWTEKDYRAAGTWLASAADGPTKNAAVQSYAQTVAPYDPQTAAQWALTLPPGEKRQQTLVQIVSKWPREDAAGAEAFAKEHGIKFDPKPQNPD